MKNIISSFIFTVTMLCLCAQTPNETEIKSVDARNIEFINNDGPQAVVNTVSEITDIGSQLGIPVRGGAFSSGSADRYRLLHVIVPSEQNGFDADILVLGKSAGVDHITNLRRIIAGYFVSAYGYSNADAATLAAFVTVYNAVYRGRMDYFASKYKSAVTDRLTQNQVGLSPNYKEWPGAAQIVIPISDIGGDLSTIDTSVISDKNVIESMRKADDRGIEDRKGMIDMKEREADRLREKVDEAKAQNQVEKQIAQQAQTEARTARQEAEKARAEAAAHPDDKEAQVRAEKAEAAADQKETEAGMLSRAAEAQKQKTDELQTAAAKKREEARNERLITAADTLALKKNSGGIRVFLAELSVFGKRLAADLYERYPAQLILGCVAVASLITAVVCVKITKRKKKHASPQSGEFRT
jgi:hypothetical protein